jgi:hypothetical protein
MYIPKEAVSVKTLSKSPIRLGILGAPGTGKTRASLSFPNPLVCDFDNKLQGYRQAFPDHDFGVLPFWNRNFVEDSLKVPNGKNRNIDKSLPHNARDAFKYWLIAEGPKLDPAQTLIVDSFTSLHDFFDLQTNAPHEKVYTRSGEEDGFAFWKRKLVYNTEILAALKNLPCLVVAIFHELPERNEDGRIIGIKPLIQGQSADKTPKDFTDFYRQRVFVKGQDGKFPKGVPVVDGNESYVWHTQKDQYFQIACKSIEQMPEFVPANFKSFTQFLP